MGVLQRIENLNVSNFYTGIAIGELTHIVNMACELCVYAVEFGFAYHITLIDRILDWHCKNGINMTGGASVFQIRQYDIERAPAARWYTRVTDVVDGGNYATAEITWWAVEAYVGAVNTFTMTGGANVMARRAGTVGGSPLYIGADLRVVAISGGGKLQARNTSTNTWADVDQWTNP
jgi:hypothetical protein